MREDARKHRRRFNSSDDLQAATTLQAPFDIDHAFKQTRPTHARRRAMCMRVIGCVRGCRCLRCARHNRGT
jgi:hypothetical protein